MIVARIVAADIYVLSMSAFTSRYGGQKGRFTALADGPRDVSRNALKEWWAVLDSNQ
jgi:hypothetical protein